MEQFGFEHPMGEEWRGFQDINPGALTRERILAMLAKVDTERSSPSCPTARHSKIARI